jgi:hypothetical protein
MVTRDIFLALTCSSLKNNKDGIKLASQQEELSLLLLKCLKISLTGCFFSSFSSFLGWEDILMPPAHAEPGPPNHVLLSVL